MSDCGYINYPRTLISVSGNMLFFHLLALVTLDLAYPRFRRHNTGIYKIKTVHVAIIVRLDVKGRR